MINLERLKNEKFLGCGCSTFGGSVSKKNALRTLEVCYNEGIIYYDVARSYGYGMAEGIVGEFIGSKRPNIILASKFGIEAPKSFPFKSLITGTARFIKNKIPGAGKALKSASNRALEKKIFTPQMVIDSLNKSLKELNTDYLDLFICHESTFEEMLNDDVKAVLETEKDKGKIRVIGTNLNNEHEREKLLVSNHSPSALQIPLSFDSTFNSLVNKKEQINIVYSVMNLFNKFSEKQLSFLRKIKSEYSVFSTLENERELLLNLAFQKISSGVVLMSTTNEKHIKRNIQISKINANVAIDNLAFNELIHQD